MARIGLEALRRSVMLLVVAVLAAGCATRASYHQLRADLDKLRGDVAEIKQAQATTAGEVSRAATETRALEARLGEVLAAQRSATEEVAALRGRLESTQAELREARARTQIAAAPPPGPSPAPPSTPPPAPVVVPPPAVTPPAPTRPPAPSPSTAAPPVDKPRVAPGPPVTVLPPVERPRVVTPPAVSPEQAYKNALATFHAREYGQAVLDLVDFKARYPTHPLAGNAQYWIGEAYYVQKDYRQALAEFQKVLDVVPESRKVPDALLMIGLCYRQLRDEGRARQTWDRVAKDYPRSEAAAKARAFLDTRTRAEAR